MTWKIPQKFRKTVARFILLLALLVPSGVMAQEVTIRIEKGTLDNAFQQIMKASKVQLVYNTDAAAKIPCEAVSFEKKKISEVLGTLLAKTNLTYRVENGIYIISDKKQAAARELGKVTGVVEDEGGEPLVGVTVVIKGTFQGVATDVNGNFQLDGLRDSVVTLVVSFIGKKSKEVQVKLNSHVVIRRRLSGRFPRWG